MMMLMITVTGIRRWEELFVSTINSGYPRTVSDLHTYCFFSFLFFLLETFLKNWQQALHSGNLGS